MKRLRLCHKEGCGYWYTNEESKDGVCADYECNGKLTSYIDENWLLNKISELKGKYASIDARGLGELENLIKR